MNKYVDQKFVISRLGDIFNDKLGITLKDVYDIMNIAPTIDVPDIKECNSCIYCYETVVFKDSGNEEGFMCDNPCSLKYGDWVKETDRCYYWEGE